jgi:hypothetical protein
LRLAAYPTPPVPTQLEANYKRLMSKLHPDRFMTKMEKEIEFSQAS